MNKKKIHQNLLQAAMTLAEIDAIVNAIMSMSKEFDPTTTPLTFEAAVANTVVTFQLTGTLDYTTVEYSLDEGTTSTISRPFPWPSSRTLLR